MINRGPSEKTVSADKQKSKETKRQEPKPELSIFQRIIAGFTSRQTKDPTHKELWCLCWDESESKKGSFLMPLPVVILTPLLIEVADKRLGLCDIDLHIKEKGDTVVACATKHNDPKEQAKRCVSYRLLADLKEEIKPYRPEDRSQVALFNTLYKHLLKAGYPT